MSQGSHTHKIMGTDIKFVVEPPRIFVRAHVYDYDPQRTLVVTTDREVAFKPLQELEPSMKYGPRQDTGFYDSWERVTVWEDGKVVETWDRMHHEWRICSDD